MMRQGVAREDDSIQAVPLLTAASLLGLCLWKNAKARCIAMLAVAVLSATPCFAAPMTFSVTQIGSDPGGICGRNCMEVISAKGEIDDQTAERFTTFLSNHLQEQNLRPVILIDSPEGGTVIGAMQLGRAFRNFGAELVVGDAVRTPGTDRMSLSSASCFSACVYALFGGRTRVVPGFSRLGIHRMRLRGGMGEAAAEAAGSSGLVASLLDYTRSMGVDPDIVLQAEQVPSESIRILSQKEIARWRLAKSRL